MPAQAERLATGLAEAGDPVAATHLVTMVPTPAFQTSVERLLAAWLANPGPSGLSVGSAVAAASHAHDEARRNPHLELVVSGPSTKSINARRTEQVLLEWIGKAKREILLITYALYMYDDLRAALVAATARGVEVTVLTEDSLDDPSFKGDPAKQLSGLIVQRLRWPADQRPADGAALHAKVAVFDGTTAFVTSANLTHRAAGGNFEAGVLIRGGDIPTRIIEHISELRQQGLLTLA
jgi:phosphatidylserine/phosphatidylglycerophosphate/cardiolipin synthase-like enzyme